MAIKVAVIGAGSVGFTREHLRDILCVPELQRYANLPSSTSTRTTWTWSTS